MMSASNIEINPDSRLRIPSLDFIKKDKFGMLLSTPKGSFLNMSKNSPHEKSEDDKSHINGSLVLSKSTIPKNFSDLKEEE